MTFVRAFILVLASALCAASAHAQGGFPNGPVKLIVPFAPGGSADNSARVLAERLSEKWKQQVIIINRPGANATIGAAQAAKSPADGYTLFYAPVSIGTVNLFVKNPGFDPRTDLIPVTQVAYGDYVLAVQNKLPINNFTEFADYARQNPGKVFHASFGGGSLLAFEQLAESLKFQVTSVPYRGESPAITALVGGEVQVMFATLTSARPFIEDGRLKALGLASKKRSSISPSIKTSGESGADGFNVNFWFGLMAPAGTPAALVKQISADTAEVLGRSSVKGQLFAMGLTAAPTSPEEFGKIVKYESERWVDIAKRAGVEPQ